jgi:CO/xanthine dehydrogenase Mo-binding subunit
MIYGAQCVVSGPRRERVIPIEEIMLDPTGRMVNDHLVDYKILTPLDMPPVESIIVEPIDPIGPFGAKGVGEMATIGTPEAISAAIHDAARVWIKDPPFTPEKVWMALKKKEEGPLSSKDVAPGPVNRP